MKSSLVIVAVLALVALISVVGVSAQIALSTSVVDVDRTRLWLRDPETGFRQSTANAPPLPRYANTTLSGGSPYLAKHSALYVKSKERVLVFGGEQADTYLDALGHSANRPLHLASNRLLVFDILNNQWYEEPTLSSASKKPSQRMHHIAFLMADGETMIVHGGIGDDSRSHAFDGAFDDLWRYRNRTWSKVAHQAPRLYGHSVVTYKGKAYVFGGTTGRTFSNRLYEIDLAIPVGVTVTPSTHNLINISFKEIPVQGTAPRARAFHGAAVSESAMHGAELLIFGGHDGLNAMDDLYSFSIDTRTWSFLGRSNSAPVRAYDEFGTVRVRGVAVPTVAHHTCAAQFPIMLCVGGSRAQPQVLEFDLALRRWLRSYTRNSSLIPLIDSRSFVRTSDETGLTEVWAVGGLTGETSKFSANSSIVKTNLFTEQCPAKFVNPDFSAGRCEACPTGTIVTMATDPHTCQVCPSGTYEKGGYCRECPPGTFNPNNRSTNVTDCQKCPLGFFTLGTGAKALTDCIKCPAGTYAENAECLPCPAGTWGFTDGGEGYDRGCKPCAYGSWSAPGQTNCTSCPPGTSSGPYVERAQPSQLHLWRMDTVVPPVNAFPGTCPGSSAVVPATVVAGTWFYVLVYAGDSGGSNGDGSNQYAPLRDIWPAWPGATRPLVTVEFDGQPGVMYEDCRSQDTNLASCNPLGRNATSVGRTYNAGYANCRQWWRWMTGFSLRFDDPTTEDVTVTVRSGQLIPITLKFKVIAFGQNILIATIKPVYVVSQRVAHTFTALDLLDRFDPTAADTVTLSLQCSGGSTPNLLVNGAALTDVTFTGGVANAELSFDAAATGCAVRYTRNGGTVRAAPGTFDVQQGNALEVAAGSTNMTNGGWLQVECRIVETAGNATLGIISGDDRSLLQLDLVNNSFTQYWKIESPDGGSTLRKTVVGGVARWIFQIYSAYPVPSTVQNGAFQCSHISGSTPLMPPQTSSDFYLNGRVNGTALRLTTDFGTGWPTTISANDTFKVNIERYDPITNGVDGATKFMLVHMELYSCPGVRLQQANTSSPFVKLVYGRATVTVKFVGPDRQNCMVLIRQADQPDPERRLKAFWTPSFDISTPTYLGHDGCLFTACATCRAKVGRVVPITVTVYTANGTQSTSNKVVLQMQLTGNTTGAVEVNGKYEQRVVNGQATFNVLFLPSSVAVGMLFYGGVWRAEAVYNTTYYTSPVFRAVAIKTGEVPVFYRSSIKPIYTCPMPVDLSATRLRIMNRVPEWIPSGDFFTVRVEAITDFGDRAVGYNEPYNISIVNCNHGLDLDTSYAYRAPPQVPTEIPVVNRVTGSSFGDSLAQFEAQILYSTQTRHDQGMYNCSLRVHTGNLPDLVVEGYEIRRVFRSCRMCAPGTYSPGGNGVTASLAMHPGGCAKCMIGTFATVSGATSEAQCEVCSPGDGWTGSNYQHPLEGRTSCPACGLLNTSVGLPGGGPCPSGSINDVTNPNQLQHLWRGRLGRVCQLSVCIQSAPCPNGEFRLFCSSYTTQGTCEQVGNGGNCNWNSTASSCSGAWAQCQQCPPGTVGRGANNNNINWACQTCAPGQYSEEWGHTNYGNWQHQYEEFRCDAVFPRYSRWCTGTGTGICPNGTYQPSWGQSSNASCLTCPAGTYAHQMVMYDSRFCGSGAAAATHGLGGDSPPRNGMCPQYARTGSCWQWPLSTTGFLASPTSCTPCPPGTYNPSPGMWDPAQCKPCRAGTYCPQGSTQQNVVDPNSTLVLDLTGFTPPTAMSFERAEAPMSCGDKWISNYPGYLQDGHFSNYVQRFYNAPNVIRDSWRGWWYDYTFDGRIQGSSYPKFFYDPLDRLGATDSGSVRCNSTGCVVFQNVSLDQEIVEDIVARVWVYIDPQARNISAGTYYQYVNTSHLYINPDLMESFNAPFAGFNVTLYSHTHTDSYSSNVTWFAKSVNLNISLIRDWVLLETVFRPPFPVAVAEFKLETHGFYHTHIHFDDAALRPAGNRICNCSTGYYYNASNPARRCMRCPPGFMCAGGMLRRCETSWSTSGEPGCRECRPNWMCDADGRGRLIACPVGTYKSNVTETCEKCLDGHACQDGFLVPCNGGRYGNGGPECYLCAPGNYTLDGGARTQCEVCPPGTTSNAMRTGCFQCPVDHYSPDGSRCYECPVGSYNPFIGATDCRPCDALFLQAWNYTVWRNSQRMLEVLPDKCSCLPDFAWRAEAVHHVGGQGLGEAARSLSTKKTIRYTAGPQVGTHVFRVHLTSNDGATLQVALITVTIDNRAPVAVDDLQLETVHPPAPATYNLTNVLFNDYDPDLDVLYFASLAPAGAQYGATNLAISPSRRTASVDLPQGFTGPAEFQYTIMDEFHADPANCLPPSCKLSGTAKIVLFSRRSPPVAVNDNFDVLNGLVYSLDVTANDLDADNDDLYIVSSTRSTYGAAATSVSTCTTGCAAACRGISNCTCAFDAQRNMCWPSTNRPTIVTYTAPTSVCGTDSFTYTIRTKDGESTATVYPRIRRCYCASHNPHVYFNFILDGTTDVNGFAFQLGYVDAVQKRTQATSGDFSYGIFIAGVNQVLVPFQTGYIKTQDLQWPTGMQSYPLNMGQALNESAVQMGWASLPATRIIANIVVMGHESADDVVAMDATVKGTYSNINYAISINPATGADYVNANLLNPIYRHGYKTFEELVTSNAAQDTLDEICSL